jgi:hypothetical protein
MKTRTTPLLLAMALGLGAMAPRAMAGDREWAVAGKVLTGLAAASVVSRILDPAPCAGTTAVVYQHPPVYVVAQPAPVAPPAPVAYVAPPPTVVYATPPVVYAAPPVVYAAPPVYIAPHPVVVPAPAFVHRPRWGFHGHVVFRP